MLVDRQEHVVAARVRLAHPGVVAREVVLEDEVVVDEQPHVADAELLEAGVLPHAELLIAHPDLERVRTGRQGGERGQHEQEDEDGSAHGDGVGSPGDQLPIRTAKRPDRGALRTASRASRRSTAPAW